MLLFFWHVIIQALFIFNPKYCTVFCYNSFGSDGISTVAHILTTTVSPENCKTCNLETLQVSLTVSFCISSFYGNLEHRTETWICSTGMTFYSLLNGYIKDVTNITKTCQ